MANTRILVVDDSESFRRTVVDYILRPAGYVVYEASDGQGGLAVAAAHEPALIVADWQMPVMDGLEMTAALREQGDDTPVILVTAEGSEAVASRAIRAGVAGYLSKTFQPDDLLTLIDHILTERRQRQQMLDDLKRSNAQLAQQVQQLALLNELSQMLTGSLELEALLARVVEAAVKLTEAEEGSLLLRDAATGDLTMVAAKNFDDQFVQTFRIKSDDSLAGEVVRSGEPVIIGAESPQKIKTAYLVRSLIYVPLKVRDAVIGVLGVDNRTRGKLFGESDLQPLVTLASYAAAAIQNARLYHEAVIERSKLETILAQTPDVVIVVDEGFRVILMNEPARAAFNVNGIDPVGLPLLQVTRNADLYTLFYNLRQNPEVTSAEVVLEDTRVLNAHLSRVQGVGLAMVMQDITHLKQLDRIKSEFVSTVSHDLRSPLTAILGYTELIGRVGEVNDMQRECISRVRLSVNQITHLITDLLDLGRIEAGFDTTREPCQMGQLVKYALEGLSVEAARKHIQVVTRLKDVPAVQGSPTRVRQMISNLIENAIKYTPAGGQVTVELEERSGSVVLVVSDTGVGIPPREQPHIFDKFYRGEGIAEDVPGTGLGLSIVKSIVETHAGRIWVDSKPGKGTTFTVVLPLDGSVLATAG